MRRFAPVGLTLTLLLLFATALPASAHRPYFEDKDIVAAAPWQIDDPTISTVVYATLDSKQDVDYLRSTARRASASCLRSPSRRSRARQLCSDPRADGAWLVRWDYPAGRTPHQSRARSLRPEPVARRVSRAV